MCNNYDCVDWWIRVLGRLVDGEVIGRPPDTCIVHLIHVRDAIGGLTSNHVALTPSSVEVSPYVVDGASAHAHLY